MKDFEFGGRVAVITGAGRGLGRSYAKALAGRGASVVVNDLGTTTEGDRTDDSSAAEVVEEIRSAGGRAVVSQHDVSSADQAAGIVDTALQSFGRVDIVINNAGIAGAGGGGRFGEQPLAAFEAVIATHLLGSVYVTRAAWPHLEAQGYGRVVMTASALGYWGALNGSAYATAKSGLTGLTRSLALEGAAFGVAVNAIAPVAQTRMSQGRFTKARSRRWRPELVVPAALYLTHESCNVSGAVIAAFAGHFARIDVMQGPGHQFDARHDVTVEAFASHLEHIMTMDGAQSFQNGDIDAVERPLGLDLRAALGDAVAARPDVSPEPGIATQR